MAYNRSYKTDHPFDSQNFPNKNMRIDILDNKEYPLLRFVQYLYQMPYSFLNVLRFSKKPLKCDLTFVDTSGAS